MKTVLLAGGVSRRLWPLNTDKNLLTFYPDSLLKRNLKTLKKLGLDDLVIISNQESSEEIKKEVRRLNMEAVVLEQKEATGMGGALLTAEKEISGNSILVLNCDDLVEPSLLEQVAQKGNDTDLNLILVGKKMTSYFDGGYFQMQGDRAVGVLEKPGEGNEPSDLLKLVVDYFQSADSFLTVLNPDLR
jgi:dTDP-glucose pyrophosphorylase